MDKKSIISENKGHCISKLQTIRMGKEKPPRTSLK